MKKSTKSYIIKKKRILLRDGRIALLRPLVSGDKANIAKFLSKLSANTRHFYILDDYGEKTADKLCKSLIKPEKLHFVVEVEPNEIIALVKFSLDLPEEDRLRYLRYGTKLIPGTVSRCGTCIADNFQNVGLGGITLKYIISASRRLGQKGVMLSSGIFVDNDRAIHMVQKFDFKVVGSFTDQNGQKHVDMFRVI
jgi:hypothetical protein